MVRGQVAVAVRGRVAVARGQVAMQRAVKARGATEDVGARVRGVGAIEALTATHLEAIVRVERDLAVVDRRARADARKRDAVDLVVSADDRTAVPHAHVLQRARAVGGVGAAVRLARDALDEVA